jgi:hypothetical protein
MASVGAVTRGGAVTEPEFSAEILAHEHVLLEAAVTVGLSTNAVAQYEATGVSVPDGGLKWPSAFCDQVGFMCVLAYLLQKHLPFDLDVELGTGPSAAHYKLHPPLDASMRELLAALNPNDARRLAEMQDRCQRIFEHLRSRALAAPATWRDTYDR